MATGNNAELLAMCGKRNPYPGKLGVIEEGALADLLLVDGDPLTNIHLIENPGKNFLVIMKDGKIYKLTETQLHSTGKPAGTQNEKWPGLRELTCEVPSIACDQVRLRVHRVDQR
jgi:hypothetical protein